MDTLDFADQPKLFINEYYNHKKNEIDLNCENEILKSQDESEIRSLNELRMSLIEKIELVKQTVLQRCISLESKYTKDTMKNNTKQIKDETFLDQYCMVLYVSEFRLFEFKLGFLLFSEYEDQSLKYVEERFSIYRIRDQFYKYPSNLFEKNIDIYHKDHLFIRHIKSAIECNLEEFRTNFIHLEKGNWMKIDKIDISEISTIKDTDFSLMNDFEHQI